jgi:hypothetical protein
LPAMAEPPAPLVALPLTLAVALPPLPAMPMPPLPALAGVPLVVPVPFSGDARGAAVAAEDGRHRPPPCLPVFLEANAARNRDARVRRRNRAVAARFPTVGNFPAKDG